MNKKQRSYRIAHRRFPQFFSRVALSILVILAFSAVFVAAAGQEKRPNILLVVVDDMGYSDIGCFGGEIRTPAIDALAESGLRMTNYYVAPTCSPTRSMLMSGTDNHLAGLGSMKETLAANQKGKPGYEGHINDRVVTIASLLRDAGYHTYMAGKWHLGTEIEHDPHNRGFEKAFTLLQGGASHFGDEWMLYANYTPIYREDGQRVHVPGGFFSSKFYVDKMINYIDRNKDDKPFFGYLAFTAPHDPLHLPDEWLDKYKGRYDQGYDALRTERLARMKKLGIVSKDVELSHRLPMIPEWDTMTVDQRRMEARRMELHAGMVENIDHHLGRLVRYLKETGKYDNTLIFFFSDNGAAATEFHQYPDTDKAWVEKNSDNRFENLGKRGSRVNIGFNWAVSSNTPLRYFKAVHAEGGIRVPCIITGSDIKKTGQIDSAFAHVMDIAPTLLDAAGVSHPSQFQGRKVLPMMGKSMLPFLEGKADFVRDDSEAVGWELFGRRAIRQGHWKAIWLDSPLGTDDWQLFDIEADPTERNDLAESNKDKLNDLILLWEQYADDTGVILPSATMELAD